MCTKNYDLCVSCCVVIACAAACDDDAKLSKADPVFPPYSFSRSPPLKHTTAFLAHHRTPHFPTRGIFGRRLPITTNYYSAVIDWVRYDLLAHRYYLKGNHHDVAVICCDDVIVSMKTGTFPQSEMQARSTFHLSSSSLLLMLLLQHHSSSHPLLLLHENDAIHDATDDDNPSCCQCHCHLHNHVDRISSPVEHVYPDHFDAWTIY